MKKLSLLLLLLLLSSSLYAEDWPDWYPWRMLWHDSSATVTDLTQRLDSSPVDQLWRVGDHFENALGITVNLAGMTLLFDACFPEHGHADGIAARLAKFGTNLLRFHGEDCSWCQLVGCDFDDAKLVEFDYLVAALAAKGIYISVDMLTSRDWEMCPELGLPDPEVHATGGKWIAYFVPAVQNWLLDYAAWRLSHFNPYRGLALKDDPVLAFVEVTNENSLSTGYRHGQLDDPTVDWAPLSQYYIERLDSTFAAWLRGEYPDRETLAAVWNADTTVAGGECILNGGFEEGIEGLYPWRISIDPDGLPLASYEVSSHQPFEGDSCLYYIMPNDPQVIEESDPWDYWSRAYYDTLLQQPQGGEFWYVRFAARASLPRAIYSNTWSDDGSRGLSARLDLTTEWQQFELMFEVEGPHTTENTRLNFSLGGDTADVWLDDVHSWRMPVRGLRAGEDPWRPDSATVCCEHVPFDSLGAYTTPRQLDQLRFLYDLEVNLWNRFNHMLDSLDCQVPLLGTYYNDDLGNMASLADACDMLDVHSYWGGASFTGENWEPPWQMPNLPQIGDTLPETAAKFGLPQVAGMPYIIGEGNQARPNYYHAEFFPELYAYGAFHGADAIAPHAYRHHSYPITYTSSYFFDVSEDWLALVQLVPWQLAFRRGDITPSVQPVTIDYNFNEAMLYDLEADFDNLTAVGSLPIDVALEHAVKRGNFHADFSTDGGTLPQPDPLGNHITDTDELSWSTTDSLFTVSADRIEALVGFPPHTMQTTGELNWIVQSPEFVSLTAVALSEGSLAEADTLLITCVARMQYPGCAWWGQDDMPVISADDLGDYGDYEWENGIPPLQMMEPVYGAALLHSNIDHIHAYSLDETGAPLAALPVDYIGGFETLAGITLPANTPWLMVIRTPVPPCHYSPSPLSIERFEEDFRLSWRAVTCDSSDVPVEPIYQIYRSPHPYFEIAPELLVQTTSDTFWVEQAFPDTGYFYQVQAIWDQGRNGTAAAALPAKLRSSAGKGTVTKPGEYNPRIAE